MLTLQLVVTMLSEYLMIITIFFLIQVSPPCLAKQPIVECRTERRVLLPYPQFQDDVCARCYKYMPASAFKFKFRYLGNVGLLLDPHTNNTYRANPFGQESTPILDSFMDASLAAKWKDCCNAAWECCHRMSRDPPTGGGIVHCPRTWDGWHCWPDTPAGTAAKQPCQNYIYFESTPPSCNRFAYKQCLPNGTWYLNEYFREWTNYTKCGRRDEHRRHFRFHVATYFVSMIALIPALVIFSMYKQLRVQRVTMHRNLFLSLLLNGVAVVLFKLVVISTELNRHSSRHPSLLDENGPGCKFLFVLTKYFRMTNYMWMFCEGYYLHKLIAAAFAEQKNLLMFYAIGWGLPILPVSIYAILRATLENEKCWAFPVESYEWVMNVPNLLSLLINLFFLGNIIRVLVTKLRATHANEPSQYRKAVRATLVLVPLFGLHFCMVIYRPHSSTCGFLEAYAYLNFAMDGLQGLMVSVTFCYLNGEVLYLLRRSYQRYRLQIQIRGSVHSSAILRRLSTTQDSNLNDSQNHHHHRSKHMENKLREINQHYIKDNRGKDQLNVV